MKDKKQHYAARIQSYLMHRSYYIKIDDIRIDLLAPKSKKDTDFDRAWKELVSQGIVEICGNSLKISNFKRI